AAAEAPLAAAAVAEGAEHPAETASANQPIAQLEGSEVAEAAEAAGTPRWGRRSSIAAAQQAMRAGRSARPRWLPPWVPFLLVLLAAGAVVATNVDGQAGSRSTPMDATASGLPPTTDADLSVASIASSSTVIVPAAQTAATLTPTTVQ